MIRHSSMIGALLLLTGILVSGSVFAQDGTSVRRDSVRRATTEHLTEAGFFNVRSARTDELTVYTVENDYYKLHSEGLARAVQIVEGAGMDGTKPVKIIGTYYDVPEVTMTYSPLTGSWRVDRSLDDSWDAVRKVKKQNSSFGKVNLVIYPQLALKNLIINQVYQTLWQISPALEVSLWPGSKFTYQVKIPIYNDGYGDRESKIHPEFVTLSQRFRDPWHLNILGKATVGTFSNGRYGAALEMAYYFPNERFSLDTQLGVVGMYYYDGFVLHFDKLMHFRWNLAANYYSPMLRTQFTLRAQQFLKGDYGAKFEMIRHFRHCSIGFYAEKGIEAKSNGGFRFQIALPPYRMKRRGYFPKISTSSHFGMSYNANNETYYYKEFRTESADNIMSKNAFNPYFIESELNYDR